MIDLQLWLVITQNTAKDRSALKTAHRAYMADLVAHGVIFASGPVAASPTEESHGGATVLRVAEKAEARRIMEDEPYVREGARTYQLIAWNIRHGDFAAPVSSDQHASTGA